MIKIYTKTACSFCARAKRLLQAEGLEFEEVNLETEPNQVQPLIERTNYRKVPQIFINDNFIGGFSELQLLKTSGKLEGVNDGTVG